MKKNLFLCFLLTVILFLGACTPKKSFVIINKEKIEIEIAQTTEERKNGLMFRENLCKKCGMLFVFKEEAPLSFWMKNTLIPLSMIFIDADLNIINIENAEPCETELCPSYKSKKPAMYVLEINKDIFDENIINSKIQINY